MSDSQEGHRTAGRVQKCEKGAKEPAGHRADKRAPSTQKCISCQPFTMAASGQDGARGQEGIECLGGGVSSDFVGAKQLWGMKEVKYHSRL